MQKSILIFEHEESARSIEVVEGLLISQETAANL